MKSNLKNKTNYLRYFANLLYLFIFILGWYGYSSDKKSENKIGMALSYTR